MKLWNKVFTSLNTVKVDKQDKERGKGKICLFTLYFLKSPTQITSYALCSSVSALKAHLTIVGDVQAY